MGDSKNKFNTSIEVVALGLLAALIVVLALPIFADILGPETSKNSINYSLPK